MPELLAHGYLALKSAAGASRKGKKVTVENVKSFFASADVVERAVKALMGEGFTIEGKSPLGVAIAGPPALFEKVFQARMARKEYHPFGKPFRVGGKLVARTHFLPEKELLVPPRLAEFADHVLMAPAVRWFATPDAPALGYYHLDVPEDVQRLVDAHAAHDHGTNGAGMRICVIDSGFHPHEWYAPHGFNITLHGTNNPADDDIGHGTGISTNAFSVAPGATFHGVKVDYNPAGSFQTARTLAPAPHVITCSWGTWGFDAALHDEIVAAVADGITVCFACGNGPGGASWPGAMAEVVSVGGTYIDENGAMQASNYASSGTNGSEPGRQCPDVCGLTGMNPHGVYIAMPTQDGSDLDGDFSGGVFPDGDETAANDGWLVASGTSSATPQVAGTAALILQHTPGLTPAQVKTELQNCCRDVVTGTSANGDAAGPGFDNATGWGLVDAFVAVHPVDIWCRDCAGDNGCVPNTYPHAWTSPDVWARAVDDHGPDINLQPEHGQANWVYVRVRNRGRLVANNVQVHLYWSDPSTAIAWPADWRTDGIKVGGVAGNTRTIVSIPAGGEATTDGFEWWPPDPATAGGDPGHFCLLVRVECADDGITHEGNVRNDNNITMRNMHVIDLLPDMEFTFTVKVAAPLKVEGKAMLTINRVAVPRNVMVELGPVAVRPVAAPAGLRPVERMPVRPMMAPMVAAPIAKTVVVKQATLVQALNLAPGQTQQVAVKIKAPKDAKPGETYVVRVDENIGATNTGHVTLMARVVKEARYVGDRGSLVVHRWGCAEIARVKPENKLLINTMNAARAMKYRPCDKCQPK